MGTMMALRAHARGGREQLVYEHAPVPAARLGGALSCQCDPAWQAQPRGSSHRTIACREPGCMPVYYEPPHDPRSA